MRVVPMARESISRLNQAARRFEAQDGATLTDAVAKAIEAAGLVHVEGDVYRTNNSRRRRYWRAVRVIREGHDAGFYSVSTVRREQMETEVSQFIEAFKASDYGVMQIVNGQLITVRENEIDGGYTVSYGEDGFPPRKYVECPTLEAVAQELQRENIDLNEFYDIEGE